MIRAGNKIQEIFRVRKLRESNKSLKSEIETEMKSFFKGRESFIKEVEHITSR